MSTKSSQRGVVLDMETTDRSGQPLMRVALPIPDEISLTELAALREKFLSTWPGVAEALTGGIAPDEFVVVNVRPRDILTWKSLFWLYLLKRGQYRVSVDPTTGWMDVRAPSGRYNQFVGTEEPPQPHPARGRWYWLWFFYGAS